MILCLNRCIQRSGWTMLSYFKTNEQTNDQSVKFAGERKFLLKALKKSMIFQEKFDF